MTTLVLVPTAIEARQLEDLRAPPARIELCGFGPVAAAARTSTLLATLRPQQVVLVGIAGTYDAAQLPVGAATSFSEVALDGVGAGEGDTLLGPEDLGFAQWQPADAAPIYSRLPLDPSTAPAATLLTVCSASDGETMVDRRRTRHPDAVAEDMEGFAVALSCHLAATRLVIVRGISNRVGDRDVRNWQLREAMRAAWTLASTLLDPESSR